jgi:non-lysosomal glucosylceramidase
VTVRGRRFTGDARRCVALPLGGVGTGNVALAGDGSLRQWQLHNFPNHAAAVPNAFFALRVSSIEPPLDVRRVLQSAPLAPPSVPAPNIDDHLVPEEILAPLRAWPAVEGTAYEAAYPFACVDYLDAALPLDVRLEAFTPFVPTDAAASSLPLVSFRFRLANRGDLALHGWLVASQQNIVGWDGVTPMDGARSPLFGGNANRLERGADRTAIVMDCPALPKDDRRAGELALSTAHPAAALPRCGSAREVLRWVETLKPLGPTIGGDWSDEALRAAIAAMASPWVVPAGASAPGTTWVGALAAAFALAPGASRELEFVLAWSFPNRVVDFDQFGEGPRPAFGTRVGNWYSERHGGARDVLAAYAARRDALLDASRAWADELVESSLPATVTDIVAAQGSLVRSPTVFQTADGRLYGFEGGLGTSTMNWNGNAGGSCPLNCSHVWNYEQALARLFPELERTMREIELDHVQAPDGSIPHRVVLPLDAPQLHGTIIGGPADPALDGMLGAVLKTYREARQGAGLDWLARYRPKLERLLGHVQERWDEDGDGVLTGRQPVTYDIDLHGANMFVGGLWLAALRTMQEIAAALGDHADAARWGERFSAASAAYDRLLWNGEYYGQAEVGGAHDFGDGCLADQLVGQWWAHQLELGHLLPAEHVRSALEAIVAHNLREGFRGFEHGYRVFADEDDSGLLVCTWPRGGRPAVPVRYCDEVWTGIEYQVAAHCVMEGLREPGLRILEALRARYDGTRRNPYNEVECGDHYARAMAGWSVLEALTGFRYDALRSRIALRGEAGRFPFVAGTGWGRITATAEEIGIDLLGGRLALRECAVDGVTHELDVDLVAGESATLRAWRPRPRQGS